MTATTIAYGALVLGGGASGSITMGVGSLRVDGTTTINAGATLGTAATPYTLDLRGSLLASTGTLIAPDLSAPTGIFFFSGAVWNTPTVFTHSSGLVDFGGLGTVTFGNNSTAFYNVQLDAGTVLDTSAANNYTFTTANNFVEWGTFNGNGSTVSHGGWLSLGALATYNATTATTTVTGNMESLGTFNALGGLFVLNGTAQTIDGSWTFWSFTKSVAVADTLTFENGETYTFGGNVTLNGAAGQLLTLQSDAGGSTFAFVMSAGAVKTNLDYLIVTDSDASGSDGTQKPINPTHSTDGGNTVAWFPSGTGDGIVDDFLLIMLEAGLG